MESGLKKISNMFQGEVIFTIPQYQRAYAWESRQWNEFYEDLHYHNINQKYFFGTLLLKESGKEKSFDIIEVVDGQQRVTTMTIFINILLYLLEKKNSTREIDLLKNRYINSYNRHKLRPIDPDDTTFFHTHILNVESRTSNFSKPSQKRLFEAKVFFFETLKNRPVNELEEYLDKIESAEVLVYLVHNSAEATLIFETTNDRGKDLTNLEKIKSFLMYKAYLTGHDATDLITRIFSRFSTIYKEIELINPQFDENNINIVSEDQIAQYHFICFFPWAVKSDYQQYLYSIKGHLNNLYTQQKYNEVSQFVEAYTADLENFFTTFRKILTNATDKFREIIYLRRVAVLFPLIVQAYRKDVQHGKPDFGKTLEVLSKFAFRVFALKAKRTSDVDTSLNKIARDFRGDFHLLVSALNTKIVEACADDTFKKKLSDANFYYEFGPSVCIYLLWNYENHLRTSVTPAYGRLSVSALFETEERLKFSTEHIHAQNGRYDFETAELTEEFKEASLNSLGNLVIDSKSANSSKGKLDWDEKQLKFFSNAPLMSQNELRSFLRPQKWDENAVSARLSAIVGFVTNTWFA